MSSGSISRMTFVKDAGLHRVFGGRDSDGEYIADCSCGQFWRIGFQDHPQMVAAIKTHAATHVLKAVSQ